MLFRVTILGCNSAIPTSKRKPTAQLLNVAERFFLIDCGEGTQEQLRKYRIKMQRINHIFISHLHGDHYFGLIGLLSTLHLLGRQKELHLYAPPLLKEIIDLQLAASNTVLRYSLFFHPLSFDAPVKLMEDDHMEVHTIPLRHSITCCGFLFREKQRPRRMCRQKVAQYQIPANFIESIKAGADYQYEGESIPHKELTLAAMKSRSYAFCSDTAYHEPIIEQIKRVDLLYHEATFMNELASRAEQTLHSTASQAASIAAQAQVKKLVIGHFSSRYTQLTPLLEEAKDVFTQTVLASEGMEINIPLTYATNS